MLFFIQGALLTAYFGAFTTFYGCLARLAIHDGVLDELSGDGVLFLAQGGWFGLLSAALFLAHGGDAVELLLFFMNWLIGLLVWIGSYLHQVETEVCFIAFRSYLCFAASVFSKYFTMPSLCCYLLYTKVDPMTTADEELKAVEMTLKKCAE